MFRALFIVIGWGMLATVIVSAQTVVPGGSVSGTWEASGSPYLIEGEITVPWGETLAIESGVEVNFQGYYRFIINGYIHALGTESDSILFTASDSATGWHGIRFFEAPDSSHLMYCIFQYGFAEGSFPDGLGGVIYMYDSDPHISHCTFTENTAQYSGGAIYCRDGSGPTITYCAFIRNTAGQSGGGISTYDSDPDINHCLFSENSAGEDGGGIEFRHLYPTLSSCSIIGNTAGVDGGGIYCYWAAPEIHHCVVAENSAGEDGGGFFCHASAEPTISHCTISGNSCNGNGCGFFIAGGVNVTLINSIVENNIGNGGVYYYEGALSEITYGDFYNNEGGNFAGAVNPPGLGQIVAFNANGNECDQYYNIFEDPLFYATSGDSAFYLTENSACIDAGDPLSPIDPDWTIADIGAFYFDQSSALAILLTPHNPPIVIPSGGGSFQFDITIANNDTVARSIDIWTVVTLPGGTPFPIMNRENVNLPAAGFIIREDLIQYVPASAIPGLYTYSGYIRDHYTWQTLDEDSFPFEKLYGDNGTFHDCGWALFGWEIESQNPLIPVEYILYPAFPNPFNPATTIRFALPEPSIVKLNIYSISGRLVAPVVDGWRDAGYHEVTFDGSDLASGVYLYHLATGIFTASGKMLHVK